MLKGFLSWLRRDPEQAHEAVFDLKQAVIAERQASAAFKGCAEVGEENLQTLAQVVESSRKYEGGDQIVAEAARAYRDGLAALLMTPSHLFPSDAEAQREAMQRPLSGSTSSQPLPVNGPPGGSSPKALPNGVASHEADPDTSSPMTPPKRKRGRPPGSKSKPKPPRPTTEGEDSREA